MRMRSFCMCIYTHVVVVFCCCFVLFFNVLLLLCLSVYFVFRKVCTEFDSGEISRRAHSLAHKGRLSIVNVQYLCVAGMKEWNVNSVQR